MNKWLIVGILTVVLQTLPTGFAQAVASSPAVVELSGARGETVTTTIALSNTSEESETYYLSTLKFTAVDEQGTPGFVPYQVDHSGLAEWVRLPESSITVAPGATSALAIDIVIPADVASGTHTAAIIASQSELIEEADVILESQTATLLLLTVTGETNEVAQIVSFDVGGWSNRLPIEFAWTIQNQGNVFVKPFGYIRVYDWLGKEVASLPVNSAGGRVLPMTNREFAEVWERSDSVGTDFMSEVTNEWNNFGIGRYKAELELVYGETDQIIIAKTSFWIIPWHLILLAMIAGTVLLGATLLRDKIAEAISK